MSNKVSFVYVAQDKFSAVTKKIGRSVSNVRKRFKGLNTTVQKTSGVLARNSPMISAGFARIAAAALGFFGAREFLRRGIEFQDSMADLSAITGATGKELAFFRGETLALAKASATAQKEVAGAFTAVASAKSELLKDPRGLVRVTEQVLLLKNAAGIELAEATRVLTESLNQFDAGAKESARFVNVLAAGSKVGASVVRDTGAAIVESAVFAKKAGVSFEGLNASIQVLAKNGIKGSKAGVALRNVFLILESTGKKKLMPSIVGLETALENLNGLNLNTKQSVKLFGREAAAAADILISKRALVKQWTKEITGTNIAQEQAEKRLATFGSKMRTFGVILNDKLIKVFLRLEPALTKQMTALGGFLDTLDDSSVQTFADGLGVVLQVVQGIGTALKVVLATFKGVGTLIGQVSAAVATFSFTGDDQFLSDLKEGFSIGGKLFGLFENKKATLAVKQSVSAAAQQVAAQPTPGASGAITGQSLNSKTDININLRAPDKTVDSVKTQSTGGAGLNVGLNMVTAQ